MKHYFYKTFYFVFCSLPWLFIFEITEIEARPVSHFARSPRAILMGDAYTAIADDEFTLFYNPAGLAKNKLLSLSFLNPDVSVSNVYDDADRFENFPSSDAAAIADRILGHPLHFHIGATPGIKLGSFGFSLMANVYNDLELRNAIHPVLDLNYRYDRGFIAGYAFTFGQGGKKKKKGRKKNETMTFTPGTKVALGLAVKHLNRQGITKRFDLFGLELLNKINSNTSDIDEIRKSFGYSYGDAWGGDIGLEYSYSTNISQLNMAFAILDVGQTYFNRTAGSLQLPSQKMQVNTGISYTFDLKLVHALISMDMAPINQGLSVGEMFHIGAELGIPFITVMGGWNGGYLSYGAGLEFWPIKIYGGFYGIEMGNGFQQKESKRALIYLSLLDFSFDP
jgi:hypothetical protein